MKKTELREFIAPYKVRMTVAIIMGLVGALCNVRIPDKVNKIGSVIEAGIQSGINMNLTMRYSVLAGLLILVSIICSVASGRIMAQIGHWVGRDIRDAANDKLNKIELSTLDIKPEGDLVSRTTSDILVVETMVASNLGAVITNALQLIGCLVMMAIISFRLMLVVLVTVFAGMVLNVFISQKSMAVVKKQRRAVAHINGQISEILKGFMVIKAFNAEKEVVNAFEVTNEELKDSTKMSNFLSAIMFPLISFIGNISYVAICLFGAHLFMKKDAGISVSVIAAFILYATLFSSSAGGVFGSLGQLVGAKVNMGRVTELLTMPEIVNEGNEHIENVKGEVIFDNVRFGYVKDKEIIHGFSAKIEPGMKVAIVGPTGAGKSTIINLLMRFYELNSGSIKIDGTSIDKIPRENLHDMLGMVLQETFTFTGSIRDNIIYSTEGVTDAMLDEVIKKCGLDYLISTLPDGLDTILSEQSSVSAGQKQLITIARVMVKNPSILILDEATSSVDTRTEKLIQDALDALTKGRTSFSIAHRLSTIKNADLIFVLKDGDIIEVGNHDELLAKGGTYAELYNSQFSED